MSDDTFTVIRDGEEFRFDRHNGKRPEQEGLYFVKVDGIWTILRLQHLIRVSGKWLPSVWCWRPLPYGSNDLSHIYYQAGWVDEVGEMVSIPAALQKELSDANQLLAD